MSATTFDSLFNLRGELEKNLLAGIMADLSTYTRLNAAQFQKDRARYECAVKIGAPLGHKKILTPTDRRFDMFNFECNIIIISAVAAALKQNSGESDADFQARQIANNSYHMQLVAHMDAYMSQLQLASKDDIVNFPNLTILLLKGGAHEPNFAPKSGYEETRLPYSGQFGIRAEAWSFGIPSLPSLPFTIVNGQLIPALDNGSTVKIWDTGLNAWQFFRVVDGQFQITDQ